MVLRYLLSRLANNEQLVQRLSESYPVRRAAQITLLVFYRAKSVAERHDLHKNFNPERFRSFFKNFQQNVKQEIEAAQKNASHQPRRKP